MTPLEAAYRRYFAVIRERCRRILEDGDADDVAQETFVKLWQSKLDGSDVRTVTAWIYRTSTRAAIDRLRANRRHATTGDAGALLAFASRDPDAEVSLAMRQELKHLARLLPPDELEVALLHRVDGLTQAEIAEVMRRSERSVRRYLERFSRRVQALSGVIR